MLMEHVKYIILLEMMIVVLLLLPMTLVWVLIIRVLYPGDPTIPRLLRITLDIVDYIAATITDGQELRCWFDTPPVLGERVESKWELVGAVRSSIMGYYTDQFYQVTVCDIDPTDDPFFPDHLSFIHIVKIVERSIYRRQIVIWRVSLLDGVQQMVRRFDQTFDIFNEQQLIARFIGDVNCYQSHGVIYVCQPNNMCIYDTRYRVGYQYRITGAITSTLVYVGCIRRLFKVDGWMIRIVSRVDEWQNGGRLRITMVNRTISVSFEVGRKNVASAEGVVFGTIRAQDRVNLQTIFTSRGMGVAMVTNNVHRMVVFEGSTGEFFYWANFEFFLSNDGILQKSSQLPHLDGTSPYISAYSNQRECIKCTQNGLIYRAQFEPPTLKYLAAKRVFNINPNLRRMITAEKFCEAAGIEDMDAHFVTQAHVNRL